MSERRMFTESKAGQPKRWGRRIFIITAGVIGGGFAVGAGYIGNKLSKDKAFKLPVPEGGGSFGAWLTIDKNGAVNVAIPNQEMGQGIMSTIAMIAAEELDCDLTKLSASQSPVHAVYANPLVLLDGLPFRPEDHGVLATSARWTMDKVLRALGVQATGGSTSTRNAFMAVRQAGASARAALVAAAAKKLGVDADKLQVANGMVTDKVSGKSLGFGELAAEAATIPVVGALKKPEDFKLIGKGMPRLDVPAKVDGSAQFGIDVRQDGQVYAAIVHAPKLGSRLKSVELLETLPGVLQLVKGETYYAVVAEGYWQAKSALKKVKADWLDGPDSKMSSGEVFGRYAAALEKTGLSEYESRGDLKAGMGAAKTRISAEYRVPFLAHAPMEPMNCTVLIKNGKCTVWAGNQSPTLVKWFAQKVSGLSGDAVEVHTPYLGGGFGRRAEPDFIVEAVEIAKAVPGRPVQTIWSREEDIRQDVYRPAALSRFEAGFDDQGKLLAWYNRIAGPSVAEAFTQRMMPDAGGGLQDKTNAEGATFLPYDLPSLKVEHAKVPVPMRVGFWRSVGHSYNAFFAECFLDECAVVAKLDPMAYRRQLLLGQPRYLKVLDEVAKLSNWDKPLAASEGKKVGRGVAIAESFHSIVAEVAEVEISPDGLIRVRKVFAAVDCGLAIDPVNIRAQVSSAIIYGLTAALYGRIDFEDGAVRQGNFNDYPMLSMGTCPLIETVIVDSAADLGGIGEVGTPPIAPAVANAVFQATGKRLRELPLKLS
jgi:isoquinoline 1-oxidoreductase subunit beta